MEVRAVLKNARVQPRKVRIVADKVRGERAVKAAALLDFHPSKGARLLHKTLISAIANARENHGASEDSLVISRILVDEGPTMKRIRARAMGRANRIMKKTSHITVVVEEREDLSRPAPGTKPKPRPTFAAPKKKARAKGQADPTPEIAPETATETVEAVEAVKTVEEATESAPAETVAEVPATEPEPKPEVPAEEDKPESEEPK